MPRWYSTPKHYKLKTPDHTKFMRKNRKLDFFSAELLFGGNPQLDLHKTIMQQESDPMEAGIAGGDDVSPATAISRWSFRIQSVAAVPARAGQSRLCTCSGAGLEFQAESCGYLVIDHKYWGF